MYIQRERHVRKEAEYPKKIIMHVKLLIKRNTYASFLCILSVCYAKLNNSTYVDHYILSSSSLVMQLSFFVLNAKTLTYFFDMILLSLKIKREEIMIPVNVKYNDYC